MNSEKLMIAFIEFMFEDIEPKWLSENEQILFDSLRYRMELQKARSEAWSKWWTISRWWWRPEKQANDEAKNKQKTSKQTNKKQANEQAKQQAKNKEDKDKVKDKEEDNNKIIISSSSEEESVAEYWNEEINECLQIIKWFNNGIINWSERKWRQYANNLIKKLKNIDKVKNWEISWQEVLQMTLATAKQNEFHSSKTTSPELIYYNLSTLLDVCRNEFKKQQGSKILHAL